MRKEKGSLSTVLVSRYKCTTAYLKGIACTSSREDKNRRTLLFYLYIYKEAIVGMLYHKVYLICVAPIAIELLIIDLNSIEAKAN